MIREYFCLRGRDKQWARLNDFASLVTFWINMQFDICMRFATEIEFIVMEDGSLKDNIERLTEKIRRHLHKILEYWTSDTYPIYSIFVFLRRRIELKSSIFLLLTYSLWIFFKPIVADHSLARKVWLFHALRLTFYKMQ